MWLNDLSEAIWCDAIQMNNGRLQMPNARLVQNGTPHVSIEQERMTNLLNFQNGILTDSAHVVHVRCSLQV